MRSKALLRIIACCALSGVVGCQRQPTPNSGYVMYSLRVTLDDEPMYVLEGITGESCSNGYGGLLFEFAAEADPIEEAIDDEIGFGLSIQIDDVTRISSGKPTDVANNPNLHLSGRVRRFLPPPQDPLTSVTGTLTISALSSSQVSGSALLTFIDSDDVNLAVQASAVFAVEFTNLAIARYCPEP